MQEAVEDGGGGGDIGYEFAPFFEGTVGGHHGRAQLVAAHDDLEEIFPGLGRELFDAHVVDDKQVAFEVAFHGAPCFWSGEAMGSVQFIMFFVSIKQLRNGNSRGSFRKS